MVKRFVVIALMLGLITLLNPHAFSAGKAQREATKPSAAAIAADLVVLRPAGLIGTVLGTCGFIISLPVTIPLKKVDSIGKDLVIAPFHYTFERPLGKF